MKESKYISKTCEREESGNSNKKYYQDKSKRTNNKDTDKGITLVALVITIIVLIILAGVSINLLFGENGLIKMSQKVRNEYEEAAKNEEQQLAGMFGKNFADYNGQLNVKDGKLLNQYNEQVQLKGFVGNQLNEYSDHFDGTTTFKYYLNSESIQNLKIWGVNVIRIGLQPEQVQGKEIMQDFLETIDLLVDNNIYVLVLLWNNENINDNIEIAKEYFQTISQRYSDTPNILYEIANEPDNTAEWSEIRDYSNTIIPIIRNYSKDNIIIIPNPSWDGRPDLVNLDEIYETDNIMTSYHMYVGNQLTKERVAYLQEALNKSIPIFVTEWGTTLGNGNDGFYEDYSNAFIKFMEINGLSWCNFLITDMNFKVDMGAGEEEYAGIVQHNQWDNSLKDEILTESGRYIKNILRGTCVSYNNKSYAIMTPRDDNQAFWQEEYRNKIVKIEFKNEYVIPENILISWDVSQFNKNRVYAYIVQNENYYELYIISSTTINFPTTTSVASTGMFQDFPLLQSITLNNVSTLNCIDFSHLFKNCTSLETIEGINSLNTSNAKWMYNVFNGCENLTGLDLSEWDTSNVIGMQGMFASCRNLTEITGIENWDVSNVTDFSIMFQECFSIRELNLANWDMQNAQSLKNIFYNATSLENLYLNNVDFSTEVLESYYDVMFGYVDNEANIYVKNENIARFIYNNLGTYPDRYKIYYETEDNWTEYTT